jgi:hypothetical protein
MKRGKRRTSDWRQKKAASLQKYTKAAGIFPAVAVLSFN